ncbi:MFS transporter [Nocardia suismassiliense]|uniref:MFS transporter n=1 Tax=Nocardia suismassiliense TaxID=2077092 RepID=UPI000D1EA018|nr:MFS transporter [Nocardia suismassiliense]
MRLGIAGLMVATFATAFDAAAPIGMLPGIAASFATSLSEAGLLVVSFAVASAIAAPVIGLCSGRFGARVIAAGCSMLFLIGNCAVGLAPNLGLGACARIVAAIGAAGIVNVTFVSAARVSAVENRGRIMGQLHASMGVALLLAVPAAAALSQTISWRWIIAAVGVLGAAAGVVIARMAAPAERSERRDHTGFLAVRGISLPSGLIVAASLLSRAAYYSLYTYIAALTLAAGVDAGRVAVVLLSIGGCAIAGSTVAGRWCDRYGWKYTSVVAMLMFAVTGLFWWMLAHSLVATVVIAGMWGFSGWMIGVTQIHALTLMNPDRTAIVLGINVAAAALGSALGAYLGGVVLDFAGARSIALASAVIATAACAVTAAVKSHGGRPPEFSQSVEPRSQLSRLSHLDRNS